MTNRRTGKPDAEGTWTNETLPLKLRRDLMNREVRQVLADRSSASNSSADDESSEARHPSSSNDFQHS